MTTPYHQTLTADELTTIERDAEIVDFDEQLVRSDHPQLQVVRFTVRAPQASIAALRAELRRRTYVEDSEPPEVGVALPIKG